MEISRGIIKSAQKIVIDGPEGIGKSSLAAMFPNSIFSDVEGSTKHMDVARTPVPSSWTMLISQVVSIKNNPSVCDTFIIDTADWAERLCKDHICATRGKEGIADFGYGNGYVYLEEEFGKLLNLLNDLINLGINIVIVAHAQTKKFEQPDEMGAYDRWELKLEKKTAALIKEWADMVLFINYKTFVVNSGKDGKGTNKAQGGKRVIYTTHHVCWDAKNRHELPEEIPFDSPEKGWAGIAHCIPPRSTISGSNQTVTTSPPVRQQRAEEVAQDLNETVNKPVTSEPPKQESLKQDPFKNLMDAGIPKPLADLMISNNVTIEEIQKAVAARGYYPIDTPIPKYDPNFINGVLIGAWPQVLKMIQDNRR
jgi:hypothetical protein